MTMSLLGSAYLCSQCSVIRIFALTVVRAPVGALEPVTNSMSRYFVPSAKGQGANCLVHCNAAYLIIFGGLNIPLAFTI